MGKKRRKTKVKTISLNVAQSCVELTTDGRQRLNLSFKEIAVVPQCIQKLGLMDELDLSRNLITMVPIDFIESFISISVLDLHSNYLEQLPKSIGRLQNLLVLNLCNNRLTSVPKELGLLTKLRTLNLCINRLRVLPFSIGALKELRHFGLSDNQFTLLPGCLARMNNLETVKLDRNPIVVKGTAVQESMTTESRFHLVRESALCDVCLQKCQTERKEFRDETK
ncbi:lrrc18 [Pungitius sinensis]